MTYLLKVSTCWILFYGIYLLFLRKETFFSINRYYLMGALLTGLIVPYLGAFIPANEASVEVYQVMTQFTAAEVMPQATVVVEESIFTWENILWSIYVLGGLIVLSRFLYGLNRIYGIYRGATKTRQTTYTLVESDKYHLPFSFFHFIFISNQLPLNENVEKVLKHEELHANQWHSIDIVFTELLQVFFWFNPILIMYKSALRQSHEYLADAYVTQNHNKNSYGRLLLQQSTTGLEVALANQFFHSQIKNRITMMYKEKSKRSAMVKYLAAVPVLVAMLLIFSSNQVEDTPRHELGENLEKIDPALENEINEQLRAKGFDLDNIEHYDHSEIEELSSALSEIVKKSIDYDIRVDANGAYVFPPTDKETRDITEYFISIRDEGRSLRLDVDKDAPSGKVATLLDSAFNLDLKVILNDARQYEKQDIQIDADKLNKISPSIDPELIKRGVKGYRTMTVLTNGAYIHNNTPISEQEVVQIISLIKEKDGQLYIKAIKGTKWGRISNLMNIASELGVKSVLEDVTFKTTNFDSREFTVRKWHELWHKYKSIKGEITVKAEANAAGDMIYTEILKDKTTIDNKVILKDALRVAKAFKVEKGNKNAFGEIVFNLGGTKPHQGYVFVNESEEFRFDNEIYLGEQVPEGSVLIKVKDQLLAENKDYTIDYKTGKLELGESYLGEDPVNVIFKEEQGDPIFKVVEEMPRFPGCEDMKGTVNEKEDCAKKKMLEFIYSNLKYPAKARDANVEGMVVVQFVIEKNGSITGAEIVREIGAGCGAESQKVINSMPTWIPGKQKGKPVRVKYTLPVKFKLESKKETESKMTNANIVALGEPNEVAKKESMQHGKSPAKFHDENIYKVVEKMPQFKGCEDVIGDDGEPGCSTCAQGKLLEFIYTNVKYPKEARAKGIDGMAIVQFIINEDGTLTDATIIRNPGSGTGEEAKRVVELMPNWIPGEQRGKKVKVMYTLPVKFKLEGEEKEEEVVNVVGFGDANEKAKKENLQINRVDVATNSVKSEVFKVVQEMPRFPGCEDMDGTIAEKEDCAKHKMLEYIYTNIKYPKDARTKGIDGMAVVQMIIERDGSVNLVSTLRDPGAGTGSEASRIVREMPTWIPGKQDGKAVRVQYTLPVEFKLEGDSDKMKDEEDLSKLLNGKTTGVDITKKGFDSNIVLKSTAGKGLKPLFVIDGKIRIETNVEEIDPDDIEAIKVLKGEKAIDKYGDKGENGVIEITMKGVKNKTKYLIDGQLFGADFYNTIEKSHINKEGPASREDKFMRGIDGELITVNMLAGYGFNSAYFPGTRTAEDSDAGLMNFVANNIKYPQVAIDNDIEGLVTVQYTVEADGELTKFKIGRSVGWGIDEAVLEMMEKLADEKGPWRAAYLDRRSVASSMVLPVKFKLQKAQKKEAKTRRLNIERLDISPNPNNGRFDLSFELEDKTPVDIYFYSLSGKLLKSIEGASSKYKNTIDLSGVQGQTILVNIVQNGKVHTNKVIIQ